MKVWKISAAGYVVGVVVNKDGSLDSDEALSAWNAQAGNYQGDSAESVSFIEA